MKTFFAILIAMLICGCRENQQTESHSVRQPTPGKPNQTPSVQTAPPVKQLLPITGAFGFTLGEKLPDNLVVSHTDVSGLLMYNPDAARLEASFQQLRALINRDGLSSNVPSVTNFVPASTDSLPPELFGLKVFALNDRRIYKIEAGVAGGSGLSERMDQEKIMERALTLKYGPTTQVPGWLGDTKVKWGDSDREVFLEWGDADWNVILTYQDNNLAEIAEKLTKEVRERLKNEQIEALSNGL